MKYDFKILWIGPMIPEKHISDWKYVSPAAIKWQKHFLDSLKKKVNIELLYYRPDKYWPAGRLLPSWVKLKHKLNYNDQQIEYINLFGLRNSSMEINLKIILNKKIKNSKENLIIISYNSPKWMKNILSVNKIRSKIKFINIVADHSACLGADGYLFLSYDYFKKFKYSYNKIHIDGAIYRKEKKINIKRSLKKKKTIFFYSGSLDKWGGTNMLLKAIKLIKQKNFELWISGQGKSANVENVANKDLRIKYLGLLSKRRLSHLYTKADVFLNPRPTNLNWINNNFPSKLFDYLAYDKPIISTWTKSLEPEYRKILNIVKNNPRSLASAMIKFIDIKKKESYSPHKHWLRNKNWSSQAEKLIIFLEKINKT